MFKTKSKAIMKQSRGSGSQPGSQSGSTASSGTPHSLLQDSAGATTVPTREPSIEFKRLAVQTGKMTSVRKSAAGKRGKPSGHVLRQVTPDHLVGKAWAPDIADLELRGRRSSMMGKHVRISLPIPIYKDVVVKRKAGPPPKPPACVGVLKSSANVEIKQIKNTESLAGPRCSESGEIIPHSLLGEVGSFLREAQRHGEFKGLREKPVLPEDPPVSASVIPSPRLLHNPLLHETHAMDTWQAEMILRHAEQRRLAGLLGRVQGQLLMVRSDHHGNKQEARTLLQHLVHPQLPSTAFWRLPERLGQAQIAPTNNRTEQGNPPTPVISGDADSMLKLKGKHGSYHDNQWFHSDYLQEREEESAGGVIKVMNSVLFDELEVSGHAVSVAPPSTACSMPPSPTGDATPATPMTGESTPGGLFPGVATPTGLLPSGASDQNKKREGESGLFNVSGPALYIDGVTLRWHGNADDDCRRGNAVVKETFVLIQGREGEVSRGQVKLINCGSTVINYNWKKLPDASTLTVARPKRQAFYFMADEGVILPGERVELLVLFKSRKAGYYSESWCLSTVPLLERGAIIKFTFKGVATAAHDYTQQCRDIETYLVTNQGRSICEHEVRRLLESVLKASLGWGQLREEPEFPNLQRQFEQENPGLHFHESVVRRLEVLHDGVDMGVSGCRVVGTYNTYSTVSVPKLRQSLLCMKPREVEKSQGGDVEAVDDTESSLEEQERETLLQHFHEDITVLSFRPFLPCCTPAHTRYIVTYSLLCCGLDSVISHAQFLCDKFELTVVEEKEEEPQESGETRSNSKKRNNATNKAKAKPVVVSDRSCKSRSSKQVSPVDPTPPLPADPELAEPRAEPLVFSPAQKYRAKHPATPSLRLYDEKVYIMMYGLLENTLDTICDLFSS